MGTEDCEPIVENTFVPMSVGRRKSILRVCSGVGSSWLGYRSLE